jgi:HSP90 family molecular chaperone
MLEIDIEGFRRFLSALFPEPDTFLRELVQNAMEALHVASKIVNDRTPRSITISVNPGAASLTIRDNGCGMSRDELREKLGRVFRSGWGERDLETLGAGQFGFGFFSSILVSNRVEVRTRPLGKGAATSHWAFDCKDATALPNQISQAMDESGFEVTLHLSQEYHYLADSDYISERLREYMLFCPFRIFVSGARVNLPSREQWRRALDDPRGESDLVAEVRNTFGWDEPPIAVLSSNDGVLAVAPAAAPAAPAAKIYRQGVFVLETEIIPAPLNFIFTGIFNVDELSLRPDRKSYINDAKAAGFGEEGDPALFRARHTGFRRRPLARAPAASRLQRIVF